MSPSATARNQVLFGAAYYAEYGHQDRVEDDLDLMAAAGFTVIRVGESVWSTWEPENGRFDVEWLQPVLDQALARDIAVVLGTPTYAVPPWLARQYPEITGEDASGMRVGWGGRQEVDYTHPAFRFHAERVIRAIVTRYHDHPAVIGFQVDNEPGLHLFHNQGVFSRFVDHLRHRYGCVERLNDEWGLVYWSHRLSTWADLWTPDGNYQPQYAIAWREFQALQTTEFIAWQAGLVREYASPEQFVTTCIAYERPGIDDEQVSQALDITSGNAYYEMQDEFTLPRPHRDAQDWKTRGVWALQLTGDRMFSSRQEPFLVTETNASSIGQTWFNRPAFDGQWRQAAWALISRGAQMIEYWHWHTLPYGTETYWGGVLPHSGRPNRVYREVARVGAELAAAGDLVSAFVPDAEVALVYDTASKWLMEGYPPLTDDHGTPHPRPYQEIFDSFYKGAFDAKASTRILHASQLLGGTTDTEPDTPSELASRFPVLVAAGLYLAEDSLLDLLEEYAAAGGHLIVGPRTGYADRLGRAREHLGPPGLVDSAGASYDEYSNISAPVTITAQADSPLAAAAGSHATRWIDGLTVTGADGADILASYDHPHFERWAAVTTRSHGAGRITLVGTVPDPNLARSLIDWARPAPALWQDLPESVTVTTGIGAAGRRVHVVHNWSWTSADVTVPVSLTDPVTDVLADVKIRPGDTISLREWDVAVVAE